MSGRRSPPMMKTVARRLSSGDTPKPASWGRLKTGQLSWSRTTCF